METDENGVELTELESELYDRQIRLWGVESQKRLRTTKVFISGLGGVGAEITKNLILSGVHSVKLHDDQLASVEDFSSQFLIPRESVGHNRAEASVDRAKLLNPMVEISADTEPLKKKNEEYFSAFDIVVITGAQEAELIRIDSICRSKNIKFFCADVWGMFGYCCADLQKHSYVENVVTHKITSKKKPEPHTTLVERELSYPSIQEIFDFDCSNDDYLKKIRRTGPAFIVMRILHQFRKKHNRDPSSKSRTEDIAELQRIREEFTSEKGVDSWFLNVFSQISPSVAVVGGVLVQEIIKVIAKKEAPLYNVFMFDPDSSGGYIQKIATQSY